MWVHTQPVTGRAQLRLSDLELSPASPRAASRRVGPEQSRLSASSKPTTTGASRVTFLDTDDEPTVGNRIIAQPPKHGLQVIVESTPIAEVAFAGAELSPSPRTTDESHAKVWPPPRRESLTNKSPTPWTTQHSDNMDTINIAVIGSLGAGKSSFIQRALRLSRLPTSNTATVRQDVEGIPHVVTLVEFDLEYFDLEDVIAPGQQIQWPKQINGQFVPRLEGAFVLYDVLNKDSVPELPSTLCERLRNLCDLCLPGI
jgi:hypothetical protein